MTAARHYLLTIVAEPDEPSIVLSQADLDAIMDLGATLTAQPAPTGGDAVFATLSTVPEDADMFYRGAIVDPQDVEAQFTRGLVTVLRSALSRARHLDEHDRADLDD